MIIPSAHLLFLLLQVHLQHVSKDGNTLPTTDMAQLLTVHPALSPVSSG